MKRAGAVLGAIVMVVAALAVRGTFSGDDSGGPSGGGGGNADGIVVACPPEIGDACRAAFGSNARIESASSTLSTVRTSNDEIDAWIVSRSWADVAVAAAEPGAIDAVIPTTASTPIVMAVWADRADQLSAGPCTEGLVRCMGDVAGRRFSEVGIAEFPERVQIGFAGPANMAGFDVIAAGGSSYFGTDSYASNDFDSTFRGWLTDFQRDGGGATDPFGRMLTEGPARFTSVVGLGVSIVPVHATAARRSDVDLLSTGMRSQLVVVDLGGGPDGAGVANDGDLLDALAGAGWDIDSPGGSGLGSTGDAITTVDAESSDGLAVKAGVLAALRTLAADVA